MTMTLSQNDTWTGTMGEALILTNKDRDCRAVEAGYDPQVPGFRMRLIAYPPCPFVCWDNDAKDTTVSAELLVLPANLYRLNPGDKVWEMRAWELATYLAEHGGELASSYGSHRVHNGELQFLGSGGTEWVVSEIPINQEIWVTIPGEPKWTPLTVAEVEEIRNA